MAQMEPDRISLRSARRRRDESGYKKCVFNSDRTVGCSISDPDSDVDDYACEDLYMHLEEDNSVCYHYRINQADGVTAFHNSIPVFDDTIF